MTVKGVLENLARSRQEHAKASDRLANFQSQLAKRGSDLEATLRDLTVQERTTVVERAKSGLRAELRRNSQNDRKASLKELGALNAALRASMVHYQSPGQLLAREGLGSERRSRLMEQIAHSGPVELASLASFAAATGDRELGAALNARVSNMPRGERPFSTSELAEALVGEEFAQVQRAALEVERLMLEAVTDDGSFESGRNNPDRSVRLALMKRQEEAVGRPIETQEENN